MLQTRLQLSAGRGPPWILEFSKKLVEKTWFLAIMEGIRCVTYSDDGTVLEMFIRLATMENWWPFICPASILAHLGILNRYIIIWLHIIHFVWIIMVGLFPKK